MKNLIKILDTGRKIQIQKTEDGRYQAMDPEDTEIVCGIIVSGFVFFGNTPEEALDRAGAILLAVR